MNRTELTMEPAGKLIVFEGPDGVGKSELARRYTDYVLSTGVPCICAAFPGTDEGTLGRHVYQLHHEPAAFGIASFTPTSRQLLHIAAHIDAIESKILPALRKGCWVVLDRFWWSTWVYGVSEHADQTSLGLMIEVERTQWKNYLPAVVFLVRRRIPSTDSSRSQWDRLIEEYSSLAARESAIQPVRSIENNGTIADSLSHVIAFSEMMPRTIQRARTWSGPSNELPFESCPLDQSFPTILSRMAPAKPTVVFDTYWGFAAERQAMFFRRLQGLAPPWTNDPILREYKFTNVYRASDRASQYLIRNVIYAGDQSAKEVFFRTLLFKLFNRIETWELLSRNLGNVAWAGYSFERYDAILTKAVNQGARVYSAAYIMPPGKASLGSGRKHRSHLKLLEQMMMEELPTRLAGAQSMAQAFELLRAYPTIGDFLAYQYVTDLNYSPLTNFSEMEFVVPGPGARDGIRKCFSDLGGLTEAEIIKVVAERQQDEFDRRGLAFQSLWGRKLQLIDCQNLFCEVDKYARIAHPQFSGLTGRTRIKQRYRMNLNRLSSWYPPKWGINERIRCGGVNVATF